MRFLLRFINILFSVLRDFRPFNEYSYLDFFVNKIVVAFIIASSYYFERYDNTKKL